LTSWYLGTARPLFTINEAEATVVRRIFRMFAAGQSPRAIAKALNAEGVPGPGGRPWRDTTIRGQVDRGTGILNNAIYVGRLEWNRCSYVKNPATGKRVPRLNPREAWEVVEITELRIVDDTLWNAVKARQKEVRVEIGRDEDGDALNRTHRRRFLLSGLLECGACGAGYTIIGLDRYGCAAHRSAGTCVNDLTIRRQEIEARVLGGLKDKLMAPEMVEAFIGEYQAEVNRAARETEQMLASHRRERSEVTRKIEAVLKAIEDGMYYPSMKKRMRALETRREQLDCELEAAMPAPTVRLHPKLGEVYREKIANLEKALNDESIRSEAAEVLRGLIDKIALTPGGDVLKAELHGDLATIMVFCGDGDPADASPFRRRHRSRRPYRRESGP